MPDLPDLLRTLFRWRWTSCFLFLGIMCCVILGLAFAPRTYVSEARLFVRVGRESVTLDPTATTGQTISVYESRESELGSVLDVMQSRVILEHVVDTLGPRVVLGKAPLRHVVQRSERREDPAPAAQNTTQPPGAAPVTVRRASASVASSSAQEEVAARAADDTISTASPPAASPPGEWSSSLATSALRQDSLVLEREKAIQQLERALTVSHGKKSSVIQISCKAESPELAQQQVQLVLEGFREQHLRINRTQGSFEFFVEQERLASRKLNEVASTLRDAKNALGLTSVEGQRKLLQDQTSLLQTSRLETSSLLVSAEATRTALRDALAQLPEMQVTQQVSGFPNDARDRTRQQWHELQIRERELLSRYTELHPQVQAIRRQIQEADRLLNAREIPVTQSVSAAHPAHQQLQLKLLEEEAKIAALQARAETQSQQHAELQEKLRELNDHEGEIDLLQKRLEILQTSHRGYQEKLEQARIDKQLENERISNINVVQPATYMPRPVGPRQPLALGLGCIAALCLSLSLPAGWEFLQRRGGVPAPALPLPGRASTKIQRSKG